MSSLARLQFYSSPLAKRMLKHEKNWLKTQLRTCIGTHVGLITSDPFATAKNLFSDFYLMVSLSADANDKNDICCNFNALPLPNQSLDVLVFQHIIEVTNNPTQMLREAERVLVPGGRLLILAENPFSLFGLTNNKQQDDNPASYRKLHSPYQVKEWLSALDIQLLSKTSMFHELPFNNDYVLNHTYRMANWCAKKAVPFGGVYCLSTIKTARPVNPLRSRKVQWRPSVTNALPTHTTRQGKNEDY